MHDDQTVEAMLHSMSEALKRHLQQKGIATFRLVGIRTGGVWIAQAISRLLGLNDEIGELDISFYRDDFTRIGLNPRVTPSNLPFETEGQHIILIDDVLMSGRTVRAAMNELFDYGRPASITLMVLIDLCRPELPIHPQVVGATLSLKANERVKLSGPDELHLSIIESTSHE